MVKYLTDEEMNELLAYNDRESSIHTLNIDLENLVVKIKDSEVSERDQDDAILKEIKIDLLSKEGQSAFDIKPEVTYKRLSKTGKQKFEVKQPIIVKWYNFYKRGVNMMEMQNIY
ncbi:hypothetical protein TNIN_402631 [Trichonephila inaurata madagascariensis]|uniref:Uncharacterized protein n=1 Tax=Trichonephila inaurata madagascariensis TaxID=2747483 RepID=A0A8X6WYI7_9ARAC|nr:hypothetical protein TNIN_402631 [Trichonephila inaurata madagascariensis]